MAVTDSDVALYGAARGFLLGQWLGACLMVASFTLLYLLPLAAGASTAVTYLTAAAFLAVGTFLFAASRSAYGRLDWDIAPRLRGVAAVVAGSAGIFWLLVLLLVALAWLGVPLQ